MKIRAMMIFMERLDTTLQSYQEDVLRNAAIPDPWCRRWFTEIVSALQYLKTFRSQWSDRLTPIVHGDLHVRNILLDFESGSCKLADFGLAKIVKLNPDGSVVSKGWGV